MYVWHSRCFGKRDNCMFAAFFSYLLSSILTYILVLKRKWTNWNFRRRCKALVYVTTSQPAHSLAHLNLYISTNVKPSSETSSEVATCRPDAPAKRQWNVS